MKYLALLLSLSLVALGCKKEEVGTASNIPEGGSMAAMPAGHSTMGKLPDLPSGSISGIVQAAPERAAEVAAGDTIFVMARNAATGALIAVTRVEVVELPAAFTLSGGAGMHGAGLAGRVRLEARVDKDGDAMTKSPGDVVGEVGELVTVPAENVVLTLTKTL